MALQNSFTAGGSLPVWKKEELLSTDVLFDLILSKMG